MNKEKTIRKIINKIFPDSKIKSIKKFDEGLVSDVFKATLNNPKKELVVKVYKPKIKKNIIKNNKILKFLTEEGVISIDTYYNKVFKDFGIAIYSCAKGENAKSVLKKSDIEMKTKILKNSAKKLKEIHNLKIPGFWKHQKHEVRNRKEWVKWTINRKKKYLLFAKENFPKYYNYLSQSFSSLEDMFLNNKNFKFVPLHWDYHFANLNVTKTGKITGVFDFDGSMKGHNLSDIGQTYYWSIEHGGYTKFDKFLESYDKNLTEKDKEFIFIYFLLHLLAVMRSTWHKEKLKWLNDSHLKILDKCIKGKYKL